MEQRPRIEEGEVEKSRTRSWTAVLMDCRMSSDMQMPWGYLMHQLAATTEETRKKKAIHKVEKLLIVAEATRTTVYITLKDPEQKCDVKLLLGTLLERFGKDVVKHADKTLHMLNPKDENRIKDWKLACELQLHDAAEDESSSKRQRRRGPACVANLAEWAEEAERGIVTVAEGTQALATMGDSIALQKQTVDTLTTQLAQLELEGQELEKEAEQTEARLRQRRAELEEEEGGVVGNETEHRLRRGMLRNEIQKVEARIQDMKSEAIGENLASECGRVRKELTNAKMDQKDMEEWINQTALRIVDFMPEVPLYVVASMSEAEREEMIKDRLSARVPFSMRT